MVDQYYLWRTARAVSVVLFIVFLELQFLILSGLLLSSSHAFVLTFLLGSVFPLGVSLLAMGITLGTYSRLCFTLFALVYVTQDKRTIEVRNGA
jgi:hypothetical protein